MQAKDLMTTDVVVVDPEMSTREVAQTLLKHTISAVPVVDATGSVVGMVSEGDLIGRDEAARDARRDWWLALLAEGQNLNKKFLESLNPREEKAKDVMVAPVVTVAEDTDAAEIARLLSSYRIKRVPVVRDGRIVGIVSRADLLRALESARAQEAPPKPNGLFESAIERIDRYFLHLDRPTAGGKAAKPAVAHADETLGAADFRSLVVDFVHEKSHRRAEERQAAVERRKKRVKELVDQHVGDDKWQALLHRAREAAEHGDTEFMLLRFPSQLCSDRGRAINVAEPDWPTTLRGEPAEIYLRWEHDLKPRGFHLTARVLEFPGGVPGDIGLFLVWGE